MNPHSGFYISRASRYVHCHIEILLHFHKTRIQLKIQNLVFLKSYWKKVFDITFVCFLLWKEIWCQFHQHLRTRFSYKRHFGSFFLSMHVLVRKKSCQNDIHTKNARSFNVDEIDPSCCFERKTNTSILIFKFFSSLNICDDLKCF